MSPSGLPSSAYIGSMPCVDEPVTEHVVPLTDRFAIVSSACDFPPANFPMTLMCIASLPMMCAMYPTSRPMVNTITGHWLVGTP